MRLRTSWQSGRWACKGEEHKEDGIRDTHTHDDHCLQILNSEPGKDRMAYGPHLLLLPAPVLANITLHGERLVGPPPVLGSTFGNIWNATSGTAALWGEQASMCDANLKHAHCIVHAVAWLLLCPSVRACGKTCRYLTIGPAISCRAAGVLLARGTAGACQGRAACHGDWQGEAPAQFLLSLGPCDSGWSARVQEPRAKRGQIRKLTVSSACRTCSSRWKWTC